MFSSNTKPQKKTKQTNSPDENSQTDGLPEGNRKQKKGKKPKAKVVKKPKADLQGEAGKGEKHAIGEKKVIEAIKPVDARVIDVSFQDEARITETTRDKVVEEHRDERLNYLTGKGTQHLVHEMLYELRNILINSGFNELESSFFVAEKDILKQHSLNLDSVYDKIYYLATTQPPIIKLSSEQIKQLFDILPEEKWERLKELLKEQKKNKIEYFELVIRLMNELNLTSEEKAKILDILPELPKPDPKLTNITLRSTFASSWFSTLSAINDPENMPIKAFSTGTWFKRGTKLDELNLPSHYGVSCVIMADDISVENGKVIASEILVRLGFKDIEFRDTDKDQNSDATSEKVEIIVNGIEIATCGLLSKKVLNNYRINTKALYINFGLEHMVMVQKGITDIRELMFPQFYKAWKFNDEQIANEITFIRKPKTEMGKEIARSLVKICEENGSAASPCEFMVWNGLVDVPNNDQNAETERDSLQNNDSGKRLLIKVVKRDKNSKLCGPAYLNEIVVRNGEILGLPRNDDGNDSVVEYHTNIRYLDAFSKLVGRRIENRLFRGKIKENADAKIDLGIIKDMEEINLQLGGGALRYILANNKKIDVRGPMSINVEYRLENVDAGE